MATDWGAIGGGAASGAGTGAMVGSAFGPWGTAIGAIGGGLVGGLTGWMGSKDAEKKAKAVQVPNFDAQYALYSNLAQHSGQMQGLQARNNSPFRQHQLGLAGMLHGQAQGRGPGQELVARHAQAQADQVLRQQLAAAQSARPGMGAAAAFHAAQAGGQAQSAVGQQRVLGGLQAQLNAIGQYGQLATQGRGMDDDMAQFNTSMGMQQRAMNDARQMELLRQRLALSTAQQGGAVALANQPSTYERMLGLGMSGMQMAAMYRQGQQGGTATPVRAGSGLINPVTGLPE